MKRTGFIVVIMLALCGTAMGQRSKLALQMFSAGVKTGINISDIRLTADCYDIYDHRMTVGAVAGAYFQYHTPFGLSVRPEIAYMGRGGNLNWEDVSYKLESHCIDLRVGLLYNFTIDKTLASPYVIVAPIWNATLGGKAHYSADDTGEIDMQLSRSNLRMYDFDLFCGAGVSYPVFGKGWTMYISGEVGYNWGLVKSFTQAERTESATVLNPSLDQQAATGSRMGRGIEVTVRVGVPFGAKLKRKNTQPKNEQQWIEEETEEPEEETQETPEETEEQEDSEEERF